MIQENLKAMPAGKQLASVPRAIKPDAFDSYAAEYDAALEQGISVSGENKEYFARGRIVWLRRRLIELREKPEAILDFGCGTGTASQFFRELLGPQRIVGVDVSRKSLEVARRLHGSEGSSFLSLEEYEPDGSFDLAFCNGVFHHVALEERAGAVNYIWRSLRPGGFFAFWENNPWNPGTQWIMSRIPFDRGAIKVSPIGARRLLHSGGFELLKTDFLFWFPRILGAFRALEPMLCRLPFGAQYEVLCRKPRE